MACKIVKNTPQYKSGVFNTDFIEHIDKGANYEKKQYVPILLHTSVVYEEKTDERQSILR